MALNPTKKIIAAGSWCRVEYYDGTNWNPLGLVTDASYNEDFHVTPGKVLGFLGPISYDSQDYSCTINIGAYVPEKPNDPNRIGAAEGDALTDLLITRSQVQLQGKGQTFPALRFVNTGPENTTGDVTLALFAYVIVATDNMDVRPSAYVTNKITLYAVERLDPTQATLPLV